ncbi:MAG: DedA family protein [Planctomycetes bacterium]|nr:DedA family protein [Planctomycetota bacterium]
MHELLDYFLHINRHLETVTREYGGWTYAILFLIVFCETGLVVTPFLPGDSLLFAAGAIAAVGDLNVIALCILLIVAAILGDTVNYHIGKYLGPRVLRGETSRLFNKKHLEKTHRFFEKYGGKTIILARFVPIVRTFAPFVAGVGAMSYGRFLCYNIVGGIVWVVLFVLAGYRFSKIPWVEKNFTVVILAIIALSVLPAFVEFWRARRASKRP